MRSFFRARPVSNQLLQFLRCCLTPEVNRLAGRLQQRRLAPACRHLFHGLDLAIPHQQRTIEIVHRGANMPRKEMKRFPHLRTLGFFLQRHW